eukprot:g13822.t1
MHGTREESKKKFQRESRRRRRQDPALREAESSQRRRRMNEQKLGRQQSQVDEKRARNNQQRRACYQERKQTPEYEENRASNNQQRRARYQETKDTRNEQRRARYKENKERRSDEEKNARNQQRREVYQENKDTQNEQRRACYEENKNTQNEQRCARYEENKDTQNEQRRACYEENKDTINTERKRACQSDPEIQEIKNARRHARQTSRNILYKIGCSHISSFDESGNVPLVQHEDDKLGIPFDSPNQRCTFCGAWFWKHELNPNLRANQQFTDRMAVRYYWSCCANGYVKLDRLPPLPTDLLNLFILDGPLCFNQSDQQQVSPGGTPTFVIQGSTHHLIGPLQPNVPDQTNFLQIYFLDNNQRRARRLHVVGLPDNQQHGYILEVLEEVMRNNRFLQAFETALDRARLRRMLGVPPVPHFRLLCLGPNDGPPLPDGSHRGQYNVPGDDSIAILINEDCTCVENAHRIVDERQIVIYERPATNNPTKLGLQTINASHADYDPLVYVLFCPSGTGLGFHTRINYNNQDNRPFRRGISYPSHESYVHIEDPDRRSGSITDILHLGRCLWQQFLVDQYCKIQDRRLDFQRNNPDRIRSDLYQRPGKEHKTILNSSIMFSPRSFYKRYMNAMSIVRELGRPSLFITMTANPNWQEIQGALKPGQTPNDRPDIVQRVFEMKVKQVIKAITKDNCFGRCMGFVYSVENQKQDAPTSETFDCFVSAEIPDIKTQPELHRLVTTHMLHATFSLVSIAKSHPIRRQTSRLTTDDAQLKTVVVSFTCPIATSMLNFVPRLPRYVGPCEAAALILGTNRFKSSHYCPTLEHLSNEQRVPMHGHAYRYTQERNIRSQLTAYFERVLYERDHPLLPNQLGCTVEGNLKPRVSELTYVQFPHYYYWVTGHKEWRRRASSLAGERNIASRLGHVRSNRFELYCIRTLLHIVQGATCFEDVRSFQSRIYPTFGEAALTRGLLQSDREWNICLAEASVTDTAPQLRRLFVMILCENEVSNFFQLWENHKEALSDDHTYHRRNQITGAIPEPNHFDLQLALYDISILLTQHGRSYQEFNLPNVVLFEAFIVVTDSSSTRSYDLHTQVNIVQRNLARMNPQQLSVFHAINDDIIDYEQNPNIIRPRFHIIIATAGTGKTIVGSTLTAATRARRGIALASASSGIASTLLELGQTAH